VAGSSTRPVSKKPKQGVATYKDVLGRGDIATSLLYVFPLFLIYEVAVAFAPAMNGVDFVSRNLFALVGGDRRLYLLVHGILALLYVGLLVFLARKRKLHKGRFLPMLLESAIYALTLGSLIVFVMQSLLGLSVGALTNVVLSLGAGVHEELVFRLGVLAGGAALIRLAGASHDGAVIAAFLVSSLVFSAAHHIGAAGEPWGLQVFVFRTLAGLLFGTIFYFRSLAHAVYTHALYDVYVLVLRGGGAG
jgi:hypothetical protein